MTGPSAPFEGRDGLWQHLGIEPPKWESFGGGAKPFRITGTSFKAYPSVMHTQGPIGLVLELRQQIAITEIESVHVATYGEALRLRPNYPEALEYLGEAYVKLGRPDDARKVLDRLRPLDRARAQELAEVIQKGK